jgi:hypothetical protein
MMFAKFIHVVDYLLLHSFSRQNEIEMYHILLSIYQLMDIWVHCFFEAGSCYVAQAGLKLTILLL